MVQRIEKVSTEPGKKKHSISNPSFRMSISNVWNRMNRTESSAFPIENGDEIKIGDFLFKVEEENIEKYYNK